MKKLIIALAVMSLGTLTTTAQIIVPKFGKGVTFQSEDNSFKAKMSFRMQNLMVADFPGNGEDNHLNMLVRRSRLKFDGHVFNPKWVYKFEMGISNRDIGAGSDFDQVNSASRMILDAVVKYQASDNFQIWFGQTKLPGNRERVNSSQKLQFVDRSLVNSYYNIDRDMGAQVHYKGKIGESVVQVKGSWSLGEGRNITKGNFGGFDYTGRVEFLPFGEFTKKGDYFSADLKREPKPKLSIGATYDINLDASRQGGQLKKFVTDTMGNPFATDLSTVFVDMIFKYKGFSILTEYANKTSDNRVEDGTINPNLMYRTGTGLTFQAGYLLKNNIEFAGRYTTISADDFSSLSDINEYTIALSKYIVGHKLKIQTDASMMEDPNATNADPGFRWRFQVELGF